jgi:hypothetical protein
MTVAWIGKKDSDPYPENMTAEIAVYHSLDRE